MFEIQLKYFNILEKFKSGISVIHVSILKKAQRWKQKYLRYCIKNKITHLLNFSLHFMEFVLFMIKNDKEINNNLIRRIQNLKNTAKEYLYKFK